MKMQRHQQQQKNTIKKLQWCVNLCACAKNEMAIFQIILVKHS